MPKDYSDAKKQQKKQQEEARREEKRLRLQEVRKAESSRDPGPSAGLQGSDCLPGAIPVVDRLGEHVSPTKTGSLPSVLASAEIALTESTVMEAWKPEKAAPLYRKSIVLEVIGKSSVVLTKNSAYQHVFLSNGKKFYRLIVWKEKLYEAAEKLKLQSVVRLSGIKVEVFFTKDKDVVPTELHNSLQFVCISDTRITVLFRKPMVDYPDKNPFPPFWKLINEICVGDSEIAMRALLLDKPVQKSISSNNGICGYIGDKSGFQVFLFVAFNVEKQDEKEAAEDFQANMEVLLAGGKVIRTTDDKVLLMVENIYCLKRVDDADKKLTRLKSYQEAKPSSPPPAKKPRRSDFF